MSDANNWDWVNQREEQLASERDKNYFNIVEGDNRFVLLSHLAPYVQVYENGKYRPAVEGDTKTTVRGIGWVYQDGVIKSAQLPYVVVKMIKGFQEDPEWDFTLPFPRVLNLKAKGAGKKEVEYTLTPSPKTIEIPAEILEELAKKPTPEEIVERKKGHSQSDKEANRVFEGDAGYYPTEEINPEDIPF